MSFLCFLLFMLNSSPATPEPSRLWPKNVPLPSSCIMTDCKRVCVPICHAFALLFGRDPQTVLSVAFQIVALAGIFCPYSFSFSTFIFLLFAFEHLLPHRLSDSALDRHGSLKVNPFPLLSLALCVKIYATFLDCNAIFVYYLCHLN